MQIFIRSASGLKAVEFSASATTAEVESLISGVCGFDYALRSAHVPAENTILNIPVPVLGGFKDLTDEDKDLAFKHNLVSICRKCYSRNPLNAERCRKKSCGHSTNLRPKKLATKKA